MKAEAVAVIQETLRELSQNSPNMFTPNMGSGHVAKCVYDALREEGLLCDPTEVGLLRKLLENAKCPNDCDNGSIAVKSQGIQFEEWTQEPCEWCHERELALPKKRSG